LLELITDILSKTPDDQLVYQSRWEDEIESTCDGAVWRWAEQKWGQFVMIGAKLILVDLFADDYDHFTSKHRMIKNISVRLANDVSVDS
jgi:hypothetical protein